MISPINYIIPQADLGSKLQNLGTVLGENRQRDKEEARLLAKEEEAKQYKLKYQADLKATFDDPSPMNIAKLTAQYPAQREAFKQSFEILSEDEKKNETNIVGQVYSALSSGNNEIALDVINNEIEAIKNSGGDTKKLEGIKESIETNPKGATLMAGLAYDALIGGKDFSKVVKTFGEEGRAIEMHPLELKKAKKEIEKISSDIGLSKAKTAQTWREYQNAPVLTQIKMGNMLISKENTKLRTMEALLKKETNELKRDELKLKIDEKKQKIEEKKTEVEKKENDIQAEASSSLESFDRTIKTIEDIKSHPGLEAATGASSFVSIIPGTDAKDVSSLIETLESQAFTAEVSKMKGLGALSESEGKKLSASVANLDRGQSTEAFIKQLNTALSIFKKGKERVEKKYNIKTEQIKETKKSINDILGKY